MGGAVRLPGLVGRVVREMRAASVSCAWLRLTLHFSIALSHALSHALSLYLFLSLLLSMSYLKGGVCFELSQESSLLS